MGLFQDITDEGLWREFLSRKREQGCLSRREEKDLAEYVENREYLQEAERIRSGKAFPLPVKHLISKTGTDKKRTVYQFPRGFGYLLKLAAILFGTHGEDTDNGKQYSDGCNQHRPHNISGVCPVKRRIVISVSINGTHRKRVVA